MAKRAILIIILALLPLTLILGCGELGQVDQGRVIAYDKEKRLVTLIQDKKAEPGNPDYNTLPPHTYVLPTDPMETGPLPNPGLSMKLDLDKKVITVFDPQAQGFKDIPIQIVEKRTGVGKDDPLVVGKKLPAVDKQTKTVTLYSGRQKLYVVVSIPEEYLDRPPETWESGDEVRIYYKEPGKAARFMNITRTDIFKK